MRWLDSITNSMDVSLSNLREMVEDRKPGILQSMGSQRFEHDLATVTHSSGLKLENSMNGGAW